jgi:hypothetical protein
LGLLVVQTEALLYPGCDQTNLINRLSAIAASAPSR